MLTLSKRNQILIGLVLVALMVATGGHHYPAVRHMLPSASWAVFFLAGVYLRPVFADPTLVEFAGRFAKYFPHAITSLAICVAAAALMHAASAATRRSRAKA